MLTGLSYGSHTLKISGIHRVGNGTGDVLDYAVHSAIHFDVFFPTWVILAVAVLMVVVVVGIGLLVYFRKRKR